MRRQRQMSVIAWTAFALSLALITIVFLIGTFLWIAEWLSGMPAEVGPAFVTASFLAVWIWYVHFVLFQASGDVQDLKARVDVLELGDAQ